MNFFFISLCFKGFLYDWSLDFFQIFRWSLSWRFLTRKILLVFFYIKSLTNLDWHDVFTTRGQTSLLCGLRRLAALRSLILLHRLPVHFHDLSLILLGNLYHFSLLTHLWILEGVIMQYANYFVVVADVWLRLCGLWLHQLIVNYMIELLISLVELTRRYMLLSGLIKGKPLIMLDLELFGKQILSLQRWL